MAMLAEQKSKQKWSDDPRNIKWSSDKDRYGYQMLERMGWADGKGLGKDKSGSTSHIKIKKRKQNLGLGAKESHDNDWIAQQADFNNLLSALQEHGGNAELRNEEQNKKAMLEVAKASRKRVFYKRFIRSKDTSQYSQKDMACIFGNLTSQSAPGTPLTQSDDEAKSEDSTVSCPTVSCDSTSGLVTYKSKKNIQEYFAHRMRELREGKGIDSNIGSDKGIDKESEGIEGNNSVEGEGDKEIIVDEKGEERNTGKKRGNLETDSRKSKKQKKSKIDIKPEEKELCEIKNSVKSEDEVSQNLIKKKKKKKSKQNEDKLEDLKELRNEVENDEDEDRRRKNKKSKKDKTLNRMNEMIQQNSVGCSTKEDEIYKQEMLSKGGGIVKKKNKKQRVKDSYEKEIGGATEDESLKADKVKSRKKKCQTKNFNTVKK